MKFVTLHKVLKLLTDAPRHRDKNGNTVIGGTEFTQEEVDEINKVSIAAFSYVAENYSKFYCKGELRKDAYKITLKEFLDDAGMQV